ncbi:MAG: DUF4153 domain-containing protein, partial [Olleya sp.]
MKQIITIIAAFSFSTLFYQQTIGLNLSIFSVLTILMLWWFNKMLFTKSKVWLMIAAYLLTAITVFINGSVLAVIANCAAFFTLVGVTSSCKTSIYVQWLNGFYTTIAGYFHRNFEVNEEENNVDFKKDIDVLHWVKLIGIPLVFIVVFILLYKNGNPIFEDLISKINFKFINLHWILLTILGYYLFNNISQPVSVEPATMSDLKTINNLAESSTISKEKSEKENQLGTTLLILLNLLIVFYIFTDIVYLLGETVDSASNYSAQVHKGVNALIASIIIAIITILFFFRGDLNFYKKNRTIKGLTYTWIALNIVLIALISVKNYQYIITYGFTYKRIGVFVYLLLTLFGLITTFLKVFNIKNLWYLFRINTQIAFTACIVLSTVN